MKACHAKKNETNEREKEKKFALFYLSSGQREEKEGFLLFDHIDERRSIKFFLRRSPRFENDL